MLFNTNNKNKMNYPPNDILILIAVKLSLTDLINIKYLSKKVFNTIWNNEKFWMNKFYHDFKTYSDKQIDTSWRKFYIEINTIKPKDLMEKGILEDKLYLIELALNRGVDVETKFLYGNFDSTSLEISCLINSLDTVKYLIKKGAEVNNNRVSTNAFIKGDLETIKYLVNLGIDIHQDELPLQISCMYGHLEIVKYLVELGKNIYIPNMLLYASRNGHLEIVKYLIKNNYLEIKGPGSELIVSSLNGHLEVVKFLVDIGIYDHHLNIAFNRALVTPHLEVVKYLDAQGNYMDNLSTDNLIEIICHNHLEIIKYLVEQGVVVNLLTKHDLGYFHQQPEIVKYLSDVLS